MKDRVPTKPNRYAVYDDSHNLIGYQYHERADEPTEVGSALNKANLLPDDVCDTLGIDKVTSEPKDAFVAISNRFIPKWELIDHGQVVINQTWTGSSSNQLLLSGQPKPNIPGESDTGIFAIQTYFVGTYTGTYPFDLRWCTLSGGGSANNSISVGIPGGITSKNFQIWWRVLDSYSNPSTEYGGPVEVYTNILGSPPPSAGSDIVVYGGGGTMTLNGTLHLKSYRLIDGFILPELP
jgi:hypothetical protein